ncbi:AAA family ATPase [Nonomuraea roseoviolacea]|uniref:Energy-coupling factor transporter ATP-binding protein EcfA2 n=1 Tax=Nonomuraea roseoviolacea subsp. carminata TaxID=160689 RepID=A0ABT1K9T4_9ACTN|nr:AAA family ATPase [Nonomuraea roseoviolacea]MCP2349729.1 energy-coupling factor transporter ATP-binding protein EcfA2 [Nonomuraea roseoviolacea subsp. carminata]
MNNIKGFEQADLDFCPTADQYPGWAVVTGDNGSGKTALLKAVCLALLGPDQARGLIQDLRGWVTEGAPKGTISVEVKPDQEIDRTAKGGAPVQSTFWAEIAIVPEGPTWEINPTDVFKKKKRGALNGPWAQSTPGWFALGYGPFRRLYGSSPDAQRLMVIPGRIPRFATLFKEDATLGECEQWVKQLKYRKLEARQEEGTILDSLLSLLGDDFLRQGITIEEVNSEGMWLHDATGRRMPLSDMSEGYRAALAMLIDIFRHMVESYGIDGLVQKHPDGSSYVNRPGVVLIDEIDAHLHPEWQREIGFWLRRHFPFVQFIVTTHSPLVCQAADGGRIYHLPASSTGEPFMLSEKDYVRVITGKPDQILLTPAFGLKDTRSPKAVEARRKHSRLVAKKLARGLTEEEAKELGYVSLFADEELA